MEALAVRDRLAASMAQRVDQLAKQMQTLNASADDLQRKQTSLDGLQESLGAGRRARQADRLAVREPQAEPPGPRVAPQGHPGVLQVARRRRAAARSLGVGPRRARSVPRADATAFSAGLPELDARMDAITSKLAIVDEGTQKAANLVIDRRRSRSPDDAHRQPAAVRRARRGAAEQPQRAGRRRGSEARGADRAAAAKSMRCAARSKASASRSPTRSRSSRGSPRSRPSCCRSTTQLSMLESQIEKAHARFVAAQQEEATLAEQEKRLAEMLAASRAAAGEAGASA